MALRPRLAFGTKGVIGGAAVRTSWIRRSGSKAHGVEKMKIAFIGLGNMGTGIAQCLLKSGHDPIVWNRTATKTGPLVALGARAATTAREAAAAADVVITSLMDDKSVLDIVQAGDGVLAGMRRDAVHACVTTISPNARTNSKVCTAATAACTFGSRRRTARRSSERAACFVSRRTGQRGGKVDACLQELLHVSDGYLGAATHGERHEARHKL